MLTAGPPTPSPDGANRGSASRGNAVNPLMDEAQPPLMTPSGDGSVGEENRLSGGGGNSSKYKLKLFSSQPASPTIPATDSRPTEGTDIEGAEREEPANPTSIPTLRLKISATTSSGHSNEESAAPKTGTASLDIAQILNFVSENSLLGTEPNIIHNSPPPQPLPQKMTQEIFQHPASPSRTLTADKGAAAPVAPRKSERVKSSTMTPTAGRGEEQRRKSARHSKPEAEEPADVPVSPTKEVAISGSPTKPQKYSNPSLQTSPANNIGSGTTIRIKLRQSSSVELDATKPAWEEKQAVSEDQPVPRRKTLRTHRSPKTNATDEEDEGKAGKQTETKKKGNSEKSGNPDKGLPDQAALGLNGKKEKRRWTRKRPEGAAEGDGDGWLPAPGAAEGKKKKKKDDISAGGEQQRKADSKGKESRSLAKPPVLPITIVAPPKSIPPAEQQGFLDRLASNRTEITNNDYCFACNGIGYFICCESCPRSFHFACADPPIDPNNIPAEPFYCHDCIKKFGFPNGTGVPHDFEKFTRVGELWNYILDKTLGVNPRSYTLPKRFRKKKLPDEERPPSTTLEPVRQGPPAQQPAALLNAITDPVGDGLSHTRERLVASGFCHKCCKQANVIENKLLIKCDDCSLLWHLDCLPYPLAVTPSAQRHWTCPIHLNNVDNLEGAVTGDAVDRILSTPTPIVRIDSWPVPHSATPDLGARPILPEESIKLQFGWAVRSAAVGQPTMRRHCLVPETVKSVYHRLRTISDDRVYNHRLSHVERSCETTITD